jgi:hypothetical protein
LIRVKNKSSLFLFSDMNTIEPKQTGDNLIDDEADKRRK